jgi:predicted dehydrogenase
LEAKKETPMVRVGIAGIGFMGWIHWLAYQQVQGVRVGAICTRDAKKRSGDWRGIKGNFGPPGEQIDLSGVKSYETLEELIADPQLDVIDICLPPHLHVGVAERALAAGKHVFCEKPMALTTAECDRMCAASDAAGRQLLIGQVLPFFPEYAWALAAIQRGDFGQPLGGYFKRVISDPEWLADFWDPERVGGPLVDLHVHDAHFIRLLFGMPTRVVSQGRLRNDVVEHCTSLFTFADERLSVAATSGVIAQQGRPFTHGFEIHCERATLQYEFAVVGDEAQLLMPLTVYDATGKVQRPELGDGDPLAAFRMEIDEMRRSVETGKTSPVLSGQLARDAIVLCHRQTDSVRKGQALSL